VRDLTHKNDAAELLEKLLKTSSRCGRRRTSCRASPSPRSSRRPSTPATTAPSRTTIQVLEELIKLAKEMDAATKRGEDLGFTDDEVAF